jgi:hypothetical protein
VLLGSSDGRGAAGAPLWNHTGPAAGRTKVRHSFFLHRSIRVTWSIRVTRTMGIPLIDAEALRRLRFLNRLQSAILLAGLIGLAAATGLAIGGSSGVIIAAIFAVVFLMFNPAPGDLLFRHAYGAVRLTPANARELMSLVAELARRADLDGVPALFLIPSPRLQAMAAGSREAPALAVTNGLVQALPPVKSPPCSRMRSRIYATVTCS